jgi:hypothetical protein
VSGKFVLRSYWWFDLTANLTSHFAGNSSIGESDAQLEFLVWTEVDDLGPFNGGAASLGGNQSIAYQNATVNFGINAATSFPLLVLLTKGHTYRAIVSLYVFMTAEATDTGASSPSYASTSLAVGTTGHAAIFKGVTIR